jgi:hypothetical protein
VSARAEALAQANLVPAGVGPDGMRLVGDDDKGPVLAYRLGALSADRARQLSRRFAVLSTWHVANSLAVRKADVAGGLVVLERRGTPLGERLARGLTTESLALRWIHDVALALGDLHAGGLVHDALEPQVILVEDEGGALVDVSGIRGAVSVAAQRHRGRAAPRLAARPARGRARHASR